MARMFFLRDRHTRVKGKQIEKIHIRVANFVHATIEAQMTQIWMAEKILSCEIPPLYWERFTESARGQPLAMAVNL